MSAHDSPHPPLRTAWLVVLLMMPVAFLNYLDRPMLASMKLSVMAEIPTIGREQNWGYMLGQFKWVYALCSHLGGYLADRFSRRLCICSRLFVWSAVTWWTGQATTYSELLTARSLMGLSESIYIPALALIADYHLGATRSRAISFHALAIYLGVIAGGFGGHVAEAPNLGWRWAFAASGYAGMLYAIPLVLLRDWRPGGSQEREASGSPAATLAALITNVSFLLMVAYFTLPALAGWVVRDWMPAILKEQFGIGQGTAGVAATLYWQSAAIVGALAGGWLVDYWMNFNHRGRIYVSAIDMACIAPAIFGVGHAGTLGMAIAFLILFGVGWGFFDCNNMPILSQIVAPAHRATGYGVMNCVSISCGGLADWGFGTLRDRNVPLSITFGVFAGLAILSIGLALLIRPRADSSLPTTAET